MLMQYVILPPMMARAEEERLLAVYAAVAPKVEAWKAAHPSEGMRIWAAPSLLSQDGLDRIAARLGLPRSNGADSSLSIRIESVERTSPDRFAVLAEILAYHQDQGSGNSFRFDVRLAGGAGSVVSESVAPGEIIAIIDRFADPPTPTVPPGELLPSRLRAAEAVVHYERRAWSAWNRGGTLDLDDHDETISVREMRALYLRDAPKRGRFDPLLPVLSLSFEGMRAVKDGYEVRVQARPSDATPYRWAYFIHFERGRTQVERVRLAVRMKEAFQG